MGIFVTYPPSNMFAVLIDKPTTILTAPKHPLIVNSITICNRTADFIRFNLQKVRPQGSPSSIYLVNEHEIKPYDTINIIKLLKLEIQLAYDSVTNLSERLECFSNGYTQKFDCEVTYTQLNDLPLY